MQYERERVNLPDGDFLDLDWILRDHDRLLILCHGLEGGSDSKYIQGMAQAASDRKWDILALNFRSCSGEINRRLRMYHHGEIEDLKFIIDRILEQLNYRQISLCGFSLGGNVVIKYLGIHGDEVPVPVKNGVAISVPCDLAGSSRALDKWQNYLYTQRFRKSLKQKFIKKEEMFPGTLNLDKYHRVIKWVDFDNTYTTQLTPFDSAAEYYEQGSAKNYIVGVRRPTLIINAENDPFLTDRSYPVDLCRNHQQVLLEIPKEGGHVGFWHTSRRIAFSESRALTFLKEMVDVKSVLI